MAKKTLNEAVVRRFQKLANVGSINEMYRNNENYMNEEEEEEEGAEELAAVDAPADDMGDADMDMDADVAAGDLELTDEEARAIIDLGAKLEAAMGGMDDAEDSEMGDDAEMPADMNAEAEADVDVEEELMEALRGISYTPSKSEVVSEVAKRVAKRLKTAKLHEAKLNRALGRK